MRKVVRYSGICAERAPIAGSWTYPVLTERRIAGRSVAQTDTTAPSLQTGKDRSSKSICGQTRTRRDGRDCARQRDLQPDAALFTYTHVLAQSFRSTGLATDPHVIVINVIGFTFFEYEWNLKTRVIFSCSCVAGNVSCTSSSASASTCYFVFLAGRDVSVWDFLFFLLVCARVTK